VGSRREESAPGWRELDRDELIRLLSSGLTPEQVGLLHRRSTDSIRQRARRWGLDCRALRARAIGLTARHPEIAAQFVKVVDGAPLHYGAYDLLAGSGARCRWRCPDCGEEWVTSVANRTKRKSGCPACADRRAVERARARPATSPPLAKISDDLIREFKANLTRPDRDAYSTPSGSNDRVQWRCRQGHEWETAARQRAKHLTQCPTCLAGLWTSRLEYQVAELVQLATGLEVRVGIRRRRADRAATEHIDLFVVEAGLLCDLDPSRWHRDGKAAARDLRKLERLAGQRYVRIRPEPLGRLPAIRSRPEQQIVLPGGAEDDPWLWASALISALQSFCPTVHLPQTGPEARAAALARADLRWRRLRSVARRRSLLSEFPTVADQMVEVVGRPEITAADLAPSGDDRALWRCPDCGHEWEARVANRTVLGTGCPRCSYRRGAARIARPAPGRSFADHHPGLVPYFIEDDTNPGLTLSDLKPNSIDRCRWTCPHCGRPWTATPQFLHRNPQAGCRVCGYLRSARARRDAPEPPPIPATVSPTEIPNWSSSSSRT
jgi:rubrerythrin